MRGRQETKVQEIRQLPFGGFWVRSLTDPIKSYILHQHRNVKDTDPHPNPPPLLQRVLGSPLSALLPPVYGRKYIDEGKGKIYGQKSHLLSDWSLKACSLFINEYVGGLATVYVHCPWLYLFLLF